MGLFTYFASSLRHSANPSAGGLAPITANLFYRASTLSGSAVSSWLNQGTAGASYNLGLLSGNVNPVLTQKTSNADYTSVRFTGNDGLISASSLTFGLYATERTLGILVFVEQGGNRNIFGYGQYGTSCLFDLLAYYGSCLFPHSYQTQTNGPALPAGQWVLLEAKFKITGYMQVRFYVNGSFVYSLDYPSLNTQPSALIMGKGVYQNYNNSIPIRIAAMYMSDHALDDFEMAGLRTHMYL